MHIMTSLSVSTTSYRYEAAHRRYASVLSGYDHHVSTQTYNTRLHSPHSQLSTNFGVLAPSSSPPNPDYMNGCHTASVHSVSIHIIPDIASRTIPVCGVTPKVSAHLSSLKSHINQYLCISGMQLDEYQRG